MDTFTVALVKTLKYEGVYSDDSNDHGGKTKWGITEIVARNYGYQGKMSNLSLGFASEIYRKNYWNKNNLDQIAKYNVDIAIKLFDIGVNMGVGTAGLFLQRSINSLSRNQSLFSHLRTDGIIGSQTINIIKKLHTINNKEVILKMINTFQAMKYIEICEGNTTQEKFIRGWFNRVT